MKVTSRSPNCKNCFTIRILWDIQSVCASDTSTDDELDIQVLALQVSCHDVEFPEWACVFDMHLKGWKPEGARGWSWNSRKIVYAASKN